MAITGGSDAVELFSLSIVFLVLSWSFFALRLWARWLRAQKLQLNDWLLFVALVAQIGWALSDLLSISHGGVGGPSKGGSPASEAYSSKLSLVGQTMWSTSLYLSKMSVLDFYVHIFKVHRRFMKICWALMGFISVCYVVFITTSLLACIPLRKIWEPSVPGGCLDSQIRLVIATSINAALDLTIVLLPTQVVWKLKMRRSRRFLVSLAFSAGLIVTVLSILRIYWLVHPEVNKLPYSVITQLEPDMSSIAACIPLLQPVLSRILNKLHWFRLDSHNGGSTIEKTGSGADRPVLQSHGEQDGSKYDGANDNPTASERLRQHLWYIPEMSQTTGNATTRDDLESAISDARIRARESST